MVDLRNVASSRPAIGRDGLPNQEIKVTSAVQEDGSVHATVTVPLTAYAAVTGKVTDPNGMPLRDVQVQVYAKRPIQKNQPNMPGSMTEVLPDGQSEAYHTSSATTNDLDFPLLHVADGKNPTITLRLPAK
jgi:hypothetical protein